MIGFEQTTVDSKEKIILSDEFDVNVTITFKEYFENFFASKKTSENNKKTSSHEMKMVENKSDNKINDEAFWSCNYCTFFHNPIDSTTCKFCGAPRPVRNVSVDCSVILASSNQIK